MKKLYLCSIYATRPECCIGYPWNDANDIFPDCQFYDKENKKLRTIEEQRLLNTQQEIEQFCCECGKCCMFWHDGKPIHQCSALRVVESAGKFSLPVI